MSEQINGTLPFPGMEESETLDFDAIFGGGSGTGDANPFDAPAAQAAEPAPTPEQAPEALAQPVSQPAPAAAEQPKTQDQESVLRCLRVCHRPSRNPKPILLLSNATDSAVDGVLSREDF